MTMYIFITYGPTVRIPLVTFGLNVTNAEVITHSRIPLKVVIAIKCEANFLLPNRLSNILKGNVGNSNFERLFWIF